MNKLKTLICDIILIANDFAVKEIECVSDFIEHVRGEDEDDPRLTVDNDVAD